MKNQIGIVDFLIEHAEKNPVSFHMPGHKGSNFYRENGYEKFLDKIMDCDITEIEGADNLFQAEEIIAATMEKYKRLYGVKKSYLLINGSSGGLIASIMCTVPSGKKIVMARNCHKSIFNALLIARVEPIYAYPEVVSEYGILGEIKSAEIAQCLDDNPEAEAVILPSPNYYGICSDIKAIAIEVHKRGKILIVDQAPGAHLKFFDEYVNKNALKSAENLGADLIINSTHKTLASFTQSAVLNLNSERIDQDMLEDKLQMIESTSPSYVLMASLDINADILEKKGKILIEEWERNLEHFYKNAKLIKSLLIMDASNLDHTKINLDMSNLGIDGESLEKLLLKENIFVELVTGNIVMCMTGIGNTKRDFDRLLIALKKISDTHQIIEPEKKTSEKAFIKKIKLGKIPVKKKFVSLQDAVGLVCAASITPYPPGIPIICPGEIMDEEVLAYVKELKSKGGKVIGINHIGEVAVGV